MVHVFISYAAPDRAIADEVASWLRADGHEPFLAHDLRNGIGSGLTEREVLAALTRLVTVDETDRRSRRRIKLAGLVESVRVALQVFVDRRLLLSDTDENGQVWPTRPH